MACTAYLILKETFTKLINVILKPCLGWLIGLKLYSKSDCGGCVFLNHLEFGGFTNSRVKVIVFHIFYF